MNGNLKEILIKEKERFGKDLILLFNKDLLLKEIKSVFKNEKQKFLELKIIRDIKYHRWLEKDRTIYSNISLDVLNDIIEKGSKNYKKVHYIINKIDWDYHSIKKIYSFIENKVDFNLTDYQLGCLEQWCRKKLSTINFNEALKEEGNSITTSVDAIYLWTFLRKFKFKYPKSTLLDLISFDWYSAGIEYLEEFVPIEDIKNRIMTNFNKEKKNNAELRNYFRFCLKHRIKQSKKFAEMEILNSKREIEIRRLALEILTSFGTNNHKLLSLLRRITDPFRWDVVELLINSGSNKISEYLIAGLKKDSEDDQVKCSFYLISMDNMKGLEFYTKYLFKKKEFFTHFYRNNPFSNIKRTDAIPYLLKLLKLSYEKDLKEDKFNSLYRTLESIFTNISLKNERNLRLIVKSITKFINDNEDHNHGVNFLYTYLDRLERQFYLSKSKNISIKEALSKLKTISF